MNDSKPNILENLVSLCKRRGFIFPGSEIYGGLANSWDYGPLGIELKNNIKRLWWKKFVQERDDMFGLDAAIIMNSKVWQASGHVEGFHDPLVECRYCHTRLRADQLVDNTCPKCGKHEFTEAKDFNMMFKTSLGPIEDTAAQVYLRPETAQGMFVNFKNVVDSSRARVPFGIAQIGKAFRNEITPGNFIFRTREFEQMEIEYFVKESQWQEYFEHWLGQVKSWVGDMGIDPTKVSYVDIPDGERAHYSKRTVDVEFEYPFGKKELYGLAYRADFDLLAHQNGSGESLEYRDPVTGDKFMPHVIEPSFGVDRTLLAVLLSAYKEVEARSGAEDAVHEQEVVLRLPRALAPIKVAILPLAKKAPITEKAEEIYKNLRKRWACQYDESGSVGKRYRRQDEIGTPFCVTIDFESLEDKQVTIRERDTMTQTRVSIEGLEGILANELR